MGGRYEGHVIENLCVTGFVVYIRGILTSMYVNGTFPVERVSQVWKELKAEVLCLAKQEGYWVQYTRGGVDHDRTRTNSSFVNWKWGEKWDKIELI